MLAQLIYDRCNIAGAGSLSSVDEITKNTALAKAPNMTTPASRLAHHLVAATAEPVTVILETGMSASLSGYYKNLLIIYGPLKAFHR